MGRKRNEESLIRYSVLVPQAVDERLKEMQKDAGEKNLSDTVRRVLREGTERPATVPLAPELVDAVQLAAALGGMTPEQVVSHVLRLHLGSVIEEFRASSERLKQAMAPGGRAKLTKAGA